MGIGNEEPVLPCGTEMGQLVDQVAEGTQPTDPEHQAQCAYCRPTLERVRLAMDELRGLAAEPGWVAPDLAKRVIGRLRAELDQVVLEVTAYGRTAVKRIIIAQIARRAALDVEDVAFASVQVAAGGRLDAVRVQAQIVVAFGPSMETVADEVRERLGAALGALTGMVAERIDVRIEDVS